MEHLSSLVVEQVELHPPKGQQIGHLDLVDTCGFLMLCGYDTHWPFGSANLTIEN